jgi:type I restriction enzyme, S subunit
MSMLERPTFKAGWTRVALGDVVRLSKERVADPEAAGIERVVGLEHIEPGDLRIRHWGDVADGTTFTTMFKPGQVLFGKRRAYQRKVAVADFEGVCSGDIYVLEPANDRLMPELLPFLCQTDAFFDHAVGTSAGSLSPRTNWTSLARFEFLLPPILEQAGLVEALGAAEKCFSSLTSAALAAESIESAYGENYLGGSIHEGGIALGEVCSEDIRRVSVNKGVEYRVAGVFNRGAGLYESEIMPGSKTSYKQLHVLKANQIVMRKLTAWEGSIAIVPDEFEGAVVSPEFPTLSLDTSRVLPKYLTWVFRQPPFWRAMKAHCRGTAVRRSRLHQRDLMKIRIALPSLSDQRRIVAELDQIRAAAESTRKRAAELKSLFNRILSEALSGEVRSRTDI